jgi:hypothetical protein
VTSDKRRVILKSAAHFAGPVVCGAHTANNCPID